MRDVPGVERELTGESKGTIVGKGKSCLESGNSSVDRESKWEFY